MLPQWCCAAFVVWLGGGLSNAEFRHAPKVIMFKVHPEHYLIMRGWAPTENIVE
jgi:hypothetical protein